MKYTDMLKPRKSKRPRAGSLPYYIDQNNQLWVCLFTSNDPKFGGSMPALPKGGVDKGEDIMAGAVRETHEETGIPLGDLMDVTKLTTTVVSRMYSSYDLHVYASRVPQMTKLSPTPEGAGKWYSIADAELAIRPSHKQFLDILKQKLNYKDDSDEHV